MGRDVACSPGWGVGKQIQFGISMSLDMFRIKWVSFESCYVRNLLLRMKFLKGLQDWNSWEQLVAFSGAGSERCL